MLRDLHLLVKVFGACTPGEAFRRVFLFCSSRLRRRLGKVWNRMKEPPSPEVLLRSGLKGVELGDLLSHLRERGNVHFFVDEKSIPEKVRTVASLFPETVQATFEEADRICSGVFDLLGSGPVSLGIPPDWHRDFKSGFRWDPDAFSGDIVTVDLSNAADVKVPWELSRFQFVPALGKAFWFAKLGVGSGGAAPESYARAFITLVEDWIEKNPPYRGVNWTCAMEAAIRVVNWLWGFWFFRKESLLTSDFTKRFVSSLIAHGRFIEKNLEYNPLGPNNHYLADLVGLVYLGVFFPELTYARRWLDFGLRELKRELKKQVYPDGVDYEGSIPYHRLALELFLSPYLLCRLNGLTFPRSFEERLKAMFRFVHAYTKPDGMAPQIGDADDGRLHRLTSALWAGDRRNDSWVKREFQDHRYLLGLGGTLFGVRAWSEAAAGGNAEEAVWLVSDSLRTPPRSSEPQKPLQSEAFPHGGFYIMRHGDRYLIMDCLSFDPAAPAGHRHASRLSFELCVGRTTYLVDPGTYLYTASAEWRNRFRSAAYHNTVVVDGAEPDRFSEAGCFRVEIKARVKVENWESKPQYDYLEAHHTGYMDLPDPVLHKRRVLFVKKGGFWIVRDSLSGAGMHVFEWYFHAAPLVVRAASRDLPQEVFREAERADKKGLLSGLSVEAAGRAFEISGGEGRLVVVPLGLGDLQAEVLEGWISPSYGRKVRAPVIRYRVRRTCPCELVFVLRPE